MSQYSLTFATNIAMLPQRVCWQYWLVGLGSSANQFVCT